LISSSTLFTSVSSAHHQWFYNHCYSLIRTGVPIKIFRAAIRGVLVALIQERSLDMEKCRHLMLWCGVPEEDFPEQGFQGILELAGRVNPDD
jgi:hypothetical protein